MTKIEINSLEDLFIERESGPAKLGYDVPLLQVSVHYDGIGMTVSPGTLNQSHISVEPLQVENGRKRPRDKSLEPAFHHDAYYLVRITGRDQARDTYLQLDQQGNVL